MAMISVRFLKVYFTWSCNVSRTTWRQTGLSLFWVTSSLKFWRVWLCYLIIVHSNIQPEIMTVKLTTILCDITILFSGPAREQIVEVLLAMHAWNTFCPNAGKDLLIIRIGPQDVSSRLKWEIYVCSAWCCFWPLPSLTASIFIEIVM